MRQRRLRFTLAAFAVLALAPASARAEDEAVVRFERGVQLYEAENFEAALIEFVTAYKLSKNYKLLYNIGICQMATRDYGAAADSFRQYLTEGGGEIGEARRKDVQDRLAKLGLMITRVRITSNAPAGTTLLVDDRPAGTLPLGEPLSVKTGRRQFAVVVAGRTFSQTADVTSGDVATIDLRVDEAPPPSPIAETPVRVEPDSPSFPWFPWVMTGALGAAATITGVMAVGARNDFGASRAELGVTPERLDDERSRAQTLGYVTDGLLVGTAIMAGLSTYFTIRYATRSQSGSSGVVVTPVSFTFSRSF
ncbi:MAG: hypothetical protein KF819_33600 [Labilithrix sp.]|nr:hypothetical protein [Labilithrix sp.]